MSKRKSVGYQRKLRWLRGRFDEGMRIKMLDLTQGGRGFIEYIPGEYAWRAVEAKGYMFIHCIWVVGRSKGKGYATLLLNECVEDAEKTGMKGVAVLTSERNWLIGKKLFLKYDFISIDRYPPFELLAYSSVMNHLHIFRGISKKGLENLEKVSQSFVQISVRM